MADSVVDILLRIRQGGDGLDKTKRELGETTSALRKTETAADSTKSSLDDLVSIEKIKAFGEILRNAFQSLDALAERNTQVLRLAESLGTTTERAQALTAAARDTGAAVADLNKAFSEDALAAYTEQASLFGSTVGPEAAQATRDWKQSTGELQSTFSGIGNSLLGPVAAGIQAFIDGMAVAGITIQGVFRSILANWGGFAESILITVRTTMQQASNLIAARSPAQLVDAMKANATIGLQGAQQAAQAAAGGFVGGGAALSSIPELIGQYFESQTASRAAIAGGLAGPTGGGGGGGRAASPSGGPSFVAIDFADEDAATAAERVAMQAQGREAVAAEASRYDSRTKDGRQTGATQRTRQRADLGGIAGSLAGGNALGAIGAANPIASALSGLGSNGADAVLAQIKDQISGILKGIVELPKLVVGLVAQVPAILIGLLKALLYELPKALVMALADLPRQFAIAIQEAFFGAGSKGNFDESGSRANGSIIIGGTTTTTPNQTPSVKAAGKTSTGTSQRGRSRRDGGGGDGTTIVFQGPVYGGEEGLRQLRRHIARQDGTRGLGAA